MGWKQFLCQVEAASHRHERERRVAGRRSERDAMVNHRQLVRHYKAQAAAEQAAGAQAEVAEYTSYIAMLRTPHLDCSDAWDWRAAMTIPPPPEPVRHNRAEAHARAALQAHAPGFFDKMLGGAKQQRAQLEKAVQHAIATDQHHHDAALAEYQRLFERWRYQAGLAPGVLALHPEACRSALWYVGAFDELELFTHKITLDDVANAAATFRCAIEDPDLIPTEEVRLGAHGKVLKKELATTKYWGLYQDHVASCALRIAREAYAVLPIERAIINMQATQLDRSTGHMVGHTILAVHVTRGPLLQLNFAAIDPSESLKNFPHRMKFKRTAGFEPVEAMTADEQWITA